MSKFFKQVKPVQLGRWAIGTSSSRARKIDLANCDSCGTCSYVVLNDDVLSLDDGLVDGNVDAFEAGKHRERNEAQVGDAQERH